MCVLFLHRYKIQTLEKKMEEDQASTLQLKHDVEEKKQEGKKF